VTILGYGAHVGPLLARALALPPFQRAARVAADWIDLQWSLVIEQLTRAAPRAHGRLLDVGCGDKPYEDIFRPYVTEYIGIEHEASFSQTHASAPAPAANGAARIPGGRRPDISYDGETIPFPDRSFDTVLSVQVLEHTPHSQHLLDEMRRVLRDDGLLILTAPFSFRLHEEPHDYFRFTSHGLRSMCAKSGLEITEMWNQGDLWSVVAHKLNSYLALRLLESHSFAQQLGKLKHEAPVANGGRLWLAPLVVPSMILLSGAARVLDRVAPDGTETLSYTILARPRRG
jgi:SAM-dependent methyltransferase